MIPPFTTSILLAMLSLLNINISFNNNQLFLACSTLDLTTYFDVDWAARCLDTCHSMIGWWISIGNAVISWKCKKQN